MGDRRMNVVLVVLDTLRRDAVGCYGKLTAEVRSPTW